MKQILLNLILLLSINSLVFSDNENTEKISGPDNSRIILRCSGINGNNTVNGTSGTGTVQEVEGISLKCSNSNAISGADETINSKKILLKCSNSVNNSSGNGNTGNTLLECSDTVRVLSKDAVFPASNPETSKKVFLKCRNFTGNTTVNEINNLSESNEILLKCSNTTENLNDDSDNEGIQAKKAADTGETVLKCSDLVTVIHEDSTDGEHSDQNTETVILSCRGKDETANRIGGIIRNPSLPSVGGNAGIIAPIIGGSIPAVGAIVGNIGRHKGDGGNNGNNPGNSGGNPGNGGGRRKNPEKQPDNQDNKDDRPSRNARGVGIQPLNPFWGSNLRQAEETYSRASKLGIQWVRIIASWNRAQPVQNGSYDWKDVDDAIALAKKYNMKVLMQVNGAPEWATGADRLTQAEKQALDARGFWVSSFAPLPRYDEDYAKFMNALVKRYAPQGVLDYEVWNEPGNPSFWHDSITNPRPNPEHYVNLLKLSYRAAHNAYNGVNVLAGGMTVGASRSSDGYINPVEFLERMYAAGAKNYFDSLSHHPYGIYARNFIDNGWANMIGDVVKPGTGEKTLLQVMAEHGDGNKKIWPTEVGLEAAFQGLDETRQANVIGEMLMRYQSSNVFGPIFLYQGQNDRKTYVTGILNIDSNGDGLVDVNIDTNGDGIPDANIDANGNLRPDIIDAANPENYFGLWTYEGRPKLAVDVIRRFINNQPAPAPAPLANGCGSATDASGQWQSVKCWEFKGGSIPADWQSKKIINHLNSHLSYLQNNVSLVAGDYLRITTRRHCVDRKGDALTDANATTGVCPANKVTQYSSGRFESDKLVDASKPFRIEIRAKMNWNGLQGMRTALWMQKEQNNVDTNICKVPGGDAPYGSLLILEWYASTPSYAWPASSISCYYSQVKQEWTVRGFTHRLENRAGGRPKSLTDEWHVWTIEFDGTKVRYYMDEKMMPVSHYRFKDAQSINVIDNTHFDQYGNYLSTMPDEDYSKLNISSNLVRQSFENDKWHIIFNDYVEWEPGLNPPSERAPFPVQTTEIDYVRLYRKN